MQPQIKCLKQKRLRDPTDEVALPLTFVTQAFCLIFAFTLCYVNYTCCVNGDFICTTEKFPTVSDLMGKSPYDKIYCLLMTTYAALKQANFRAHYLRLSGITSDSTNTALLCIGLSSCISGPLIAYFDRYSDVHTHSIVVVFFVIAEVLYFFIYAGILNNHPLKFIGCEGQIQTLNIMKYITLAIGGISIYAKITGQSIGGYSAMIELIVFCISMGVYATLVKISPYVSIVVPEKKQH